MSSNRVMIVRGGEFRRRTGAELVAVTKCTLQLRAARYIEPCERAFVQFEEILRERADDEIKYEWENVYREGLKVAFNVNWYELDFFEDRKGAYRVGPHPLAFQRFGSVPEDFRLRHRILVKNR